MALIPPSYLDCVVAIGAQQNGTHQWMGTGFLFGYRDDGYKTELYSLYIVTNKHVFNGFDRVCVRFNPQGGQPAKVYNLDLISNDNVLYKQHPASNIDIAVVKINAQLLRNDGILFSFFRCDRDCYYLSDLRSIQVTEGDGIFALGYPMGNVGTNRQYVIVRNGSIARVKDMLDGYSSDFIIDAFVFPGNSGGPVIIKPELSCINGTNNNPNSRLIGVVKSYIPYKDFAISPQTGNVRVVFEENTGLTNVEPVDYIIETIKLL